MPWSARPRHVAAVIWQPFAGIPAVLNDPTYRPLCLFYFFASANSALWVSFLPLWLTQNLGATPADVGWFFSANFLAAALGNLTMPPLADRVGNRRLVASALALSGVVGQVGMALATGYWMALIAITPIWFSAALFSMLNGLAGDAARARAATGAPDQTGTVVGTLTVAFGIGSTLTPLLGGWLYQTTGDLRPAFLLGLVPLAAATWLVWRHIPGLGRRSQPDATPEESVQAEGDVDTTGQQSSTSRPLRTMRGAMVVFLVALLLFKLSDSRGPFESLFAAQEMGASRAAVGVLIALGSGLALLLTPLAGSLVDRFGAGATVAFGMAFAGVHGLLLSQVGAFWQQLAILVIVQVALAIGMVAPVVFAQHLAPQRAATASGWATACIFLGLCAGNPLAGRLVEAFGFRDLFVFSGAVDLLAAIPVGLLALRIAGR
jgi:SET family sugar efflux transporter-like MFS transporter